MCIHEKRAIGQRRKIRGNLRLLQIPAAVIIISMKSAIGILCLALLLVFFAGCVTADSTCPAVQQTPLRGDDGCDDDRPARRTMVTTGATTGETTTAPATTVATTGETTTAPATTMVTTAALTGEPPTRPGRLTPPGWPLPRDGRGDDDRPGPDARAEPPSTTLPLILIGIVAVVAIVGIGWWMSRTSPANGPAVPSIRPILITYAPPAGSSAQVVGTVDPVLRADHRVLVYINVRGRWWARSREGRSPSRGSSPTGRGGAPSSPEEKITWHRRSRHTWSRRP